MSIPEYVSQSPNTVTGCSGSAAMVSVRSVERPTCVHCSTPLVVPSMVAMIGATSICFPERSSSNTPSCARVVVASRHSSSSAESSGRR